MSENPISQITDELTADIQDPIAQAKFDSGKDHAKQAVDDLKTAATAKASELKATASAKAQELRGKAENVYTDYRERAQTFRDDGEQYVRENPTKAVFTALGVGFVLGLIFRR